MQLIVLFNLKPEANRAEYEAWAKEVDVPTVKSLNSVKDFKLCKSTGLFGSDAKPPYEYVELIDIPDPQKFGEDVTSQAIQDVARQFQTFAEDPVFMTSDLVV